MFYETSEKSKERTRFKTKYEKNPTQYCFGTLYCRTIQRIFEISRFYHETTERFQDNKSKTTRMYAAARWRIERALDDIYPNTRRWQTHTGKCIISQHDLHTIDRTKTIESKSVHCVWAWRSSARPVVELFRPFWRTNNETYVAYFSLSRNSGLDRGVWRWASRYYYTIDDPMNGMIISETPPAQTRRKHSWCKYYTHAAWWSPISQIFERSVYNFRNDMVAVI